MIEILDNYKGSKNKKYASDYRAILNWVVDRYKEELQKMDTKIKEQFQAVLGRQVEKAIETRFRITNFSQADITEMLGMCYKQEVEKDVFLSKMIVIPRLRLLRLLSGFAVIIK